MQKICHRKKLLDYRIFFKNNYQIWTLYDGETPGAIFNSRLKREISTIRVFSSQSTDQTSIVYI